MIDDPNQYSQVIADPQTYLLVVHNNLFMLETFEALNFKLKTKRRWEPLLGFSKKFHQRKEINLIKKRKRPK